MKNSIFKSIFGYPILIIVLCTTLAAINAAVQEQREAYFNGSSYIRLFQPMLLWRHSAISFRTCRGGELFSQSYKEHTLSVKVLADGVSVSLVTPRANPVEARVSVHLLDNQWHTLQFVYQGGNLNLIVENIPTVIANATYNSLFLTDDEIKRETAILIVGNKYSGCLLQGPNLVFRTESNGGVVFGPCPLALGPCSDTDILIREPVDHCKNEPCMQHGVCISKSDGYECKCYARYDGKNCQIDIGSPCRKFPCKNGATCEEDHKGDFICHCPFGLAGVTCEQESNVNPLCEKSPCYNNGSCTVDAFNQIKCVCLDGFSGERCENDRNDCDSQPCLNNGRCVDKIGGFSCDCTGTGYAGHLCQNNIDECATGPCLNGGVCFDNYGFYTCECPSGFGGQNCEQVVSECLSLPCQHGGTCLELNGGFECKCAPGFTGILCEIAPPCNPPCPIDSECVGGRCVCKPGTTGLIGHCIHKTMPSVKTAKSNACPSNCLNGGTCIGNASNYTCVCLKNYTGIRCELPMALPFQEGCDCQNGGTCINKTHCICPNGFDGKKCEKQELCSPANCADPMQCINGKCICPPNESCVSPCVNSPCLNGASCLAHGKNYVCQCVSGFNGTHCENDIDECKSQPDICEHGICVNKPGSFQCYCEPGYTGVRCDLDVDECLSHPCQNNGTCINKINDFECRCAPGYTGKDCSTDIDECASNPCFKGSTCLNQIADFTCICIPGMTGRLCDIDIDDCESQPCQHGGKCIDQLGGFKCDCEGTGYSGVLCQMNIDECASNPCQNQAKCEDKVNDYFCDCYAGYTGKNCEEDINECEPNPCLHGGRCLERSNISLYQSSQQYSLPPTFSQKFSIENASGYECVCVAGTTGTNCEVNINECDSSPCKNGNCIDGVGYYTCDCEPGFEGEHCEIDINECDKYQPCVNGTCIDGRDDYVCDCDGGWGGKNCSVELIGCSDSPCLNNGSCIPFLENETDHKFNCSCLNGFQGSTCEQGTTMSLVASSLLTVNTTREEGYDISLRFRTTLPNGILAFGNANAYSYILELKNGRLNLHSSLLNKWEGVFIGSSLNDTQWQKVFVAINSSHLVLSANEEQTIYPINSYEGSNMSHTSFPVTYLGGTIPNLHSYLRHLNNHEPTSFVGCMQDVVINGQWVLPGTQNPYTSLLNVQEGCQRTAQCDPNPCNSNGHCTDLWHTYRCTCQRPHLGPTCKYNITAATFGNENTNHSAVIVTVSDIARRTIRSMLNISMFVRTRQSTGTIFHLGSATRGTAEPTGSYVSSQLDKGELFVRMRFNGTPEGYTVGGNKLDNGYNHLIEVIRNGTLVQVKLNGTEYFRKTLSSSGNLNAQLLYLGGPPIDPEAEDQFTAEEKDRMYFKGIIQDVQISNGSEYGLMGVELYPLKEQEEGLELPRPFGDVTIDRSSVLEGVVSDDLCKTKPCQHDAECQNTWNDFVCICPRGYKGKLCQDIQFCELQKCPGNAECKNLDDGYDCVANITFQGNQEEPLAFSFSGKDDEQGSKIDSTIEISYRTKTGGTLLYVQDGDMYFEVAVLKDQVTIQWHLSSGLPETNRFHKDDTNIEWNTILIKVQDGKLEAGWKGWEDYLEPVPSISVSIDYNAFMHLFSGKFMIYLGGAPDNDVVPKGNDIGHMFKGCLGEIRVGGMLLPYFSHEEIYPEASSRLKSYFILNSTKPEEGCVVCFQQDCQNGGICTNASEVYACECPAGYANDDCSINIDECLESLCTNNSTCIDGIATYTCDCFPGWEGKYCEKEIDECASSPCHNGGTCTDLLATFQCTCTEEYAGPQCDVLRLVTCENHPCKNGSTCLDGVNATTGNNFTCLCTPGFQGPLCDLAFCQVKPCENEGFCLVNELPMPKCECSLGFEGEYCETNINDCDPNPCQNNGYCVDEVNGYQCNCHKTGFEGVNCEIDIDECTSGLVSCGSGTCINLPGSFKCECEYGLCGRGCASVDVCAGVNVCENGGHCIETCDEDTDYFCNCTFGYTGKNCTEQDTSENFDTSDNEILVDDLNKKLERVYNDSTLDDEVAIESKGPSTADIALIVIPVVIGLIALLGALLGTLLVMARNKRATRGTYSPSAQEYCNPRLEMDNVLKPPPEERLI